ncbi:MAG: RagB/SusD family nutrient uptake outer membrane protein, partial [Bacteroidota bacterium]|nr:RagB/SusD family nutrient uptake outer membrane protein [Bacteroidota bacterium]
YTLEAGYFANFKINNEGSNENMFVIPYQNGIANGFGIYFQALHQSANGTFGGPTTPWGGFSVQEDFYNAFDDEDARKGMFIVGQQYTIAGGPSYSDDEGFFYSNPNDAARLNNCVEDWDNYASTPNLQSQIESECNVIITPDYQLLGGRYLYKNGARYGKWEYPLGASRDLDNDFAIYRYAQVLLMRAEALWRLDSGSTEALMLVNQIRQRADLVDLPSLTEDDLYWEIKKELALENHAREITIRFGHWEDDWFLKTGNKEEFRRFYPIPQGQLQANPNLTQNQGY